MKKVLFLFLFFIFSSVIFSQTPTPTTVPPIEDDTDVVKISTTLIQLDVIVTDKKGKIVTDLKPEDFEIYENGQKQEITNFSFIAVTPKNEVIEEPNTQSVSKNKNAIPVAPVKLKAEQVKRTYALVVDDLGLSFANIFWVKESLKKFVNEQMQEGDLVAIVRTGSSRGALQSFTSDKRQLLTVIDKIKWNSFGRVGISSFEPIRPDFKDEIEITSQLKVKVAGADTDKSAEDQIQDFRNSNFSVGTLGALKYIVSGMSELPGRKAVVLFSEGFNITSNGTPNRVLDAMKILVDLANRSSVIFYTLDPRGLQAPGMAQAADDIKEVIPDGYDPANYVDPRDSRISDFADSQQSLRYLAKETGGISYINQNNLNAGIKRVLDDQGSYYLIGYQPNGETFNPKKSSFNKLEIKLNRADLKARYRSGFFNITDEKLQKLVKTSQEKLMSALASPFGANGINLILYPIYHNDEKEGNIIQALVYIDAKDLKFTQANGNYKANFDLLAMTYGDNGVKLDQVYKNYTIEVSEKNYQNMMTKGVVYNLPVAIKKSGAYQFRIALRDTASDKVGSASQFVEVPDFKKRMSVSNLLIDSFTPEEWRKVSLGGDRDASEKSLLFDTTLRQFKSGTFLRYDYAVYNPKKSQSLSTQVRLIREGKIVFEQPLSPIKMTGQTDLLRLQMEGAITLGKNLEAGGYVLQIIVTDDTSEKKFASQFVEFEIIN